MKKNTFYIENESAIRKLFQWEQNRKQKYLEKKKKDAKQKTKNKKPWKKKLGETFFVKSGDGKGKLILAL